jgi:hypothetical protein
MSRVQGDHLEGDKRCANEIIHWTALFCVRNIAGKAFEAESRDNEIDLEVLRRFL